MSWSSNVQSSSISRPPSFVARNLQTSPVTSIVCRSLLRTDLGRSGTSELPDGCLFAFICSPLANCDSAPRETDKRPSLRRSGCNGMACLIPLSTRRVRVRSEQHAPHQVPAKRDLQQFLQPRYAGSCAMRGHRCEQTVCDEIWSNVFLEN